MKNFKILHPIGGVLNHNMDRGLYEFEQICSIDCESLEQAFKLSQNDFSERYTSLNKRSTSVGDIIIDTEELIHYMVAGKGFIEIPPTVAQYIDWGNHMEDMELEVGMGDMQEQALNSFKAQYPMVTSGDMQTFILGMIAQEKIQKKIRLTK